MKSFRQLAFSLFRGSKWMVLSAVFSVALSLALIALFLSFSDAAKTKMQEDLQFMYGDMDLSVGYNPAQEILVTSDLRKNIEALPDVAQTSGVMISNFNLTEWGQSIYTLGLENDDLSKSRYHFQKDLQVGEVILSEGIVKSHQLKIGDTVQIEGQPFRLAEVLQQFAAAGVQIDIMILNQDAVSEMLQKLYQKSTDPIYLLVKLGEDADALSIANEIRTLDERLRIDVAEENSVVVQNLQALFYFNLVISIFVVLVTGFLLLSTFDLINYKNKNQMAILRTMGASSKQIGQILQTQIGLILFTGTALGILFTIGAKGIVYELLARYFSVEISPSALPLTMVAGIVFVYLIVVYIFMYLPVYKSMKILPLQSMEQSEQLTFSFSKGRKVFGSILLGISIFFFLFSFTRPGQYQPFLILLSVLLFIFAFCLLLSIYLTVILQKISKSVERRGGNISYLAMKNMIPQVRKNTFLILSICFLLVLAIFGSTVLKTVQAGDDAYLKSQYLTNIVIKNRLGNDSQILLKPFLEQVKAIDGVQTVSAVSWEKPMYFQQNGEWKSGGVILGDLTALQVHNFFHMEQAAFDKREMVVSKKFADDHALQVGDVIEIRKSTVDSFTLGEPMENISKSIGSFTIKYIVSGVPIEMMFDYQDFDETSRFTDRVFVQSDNLAQTLEQLAELESAYPEIQISNYEASVKEAHQMFQQRWSVFIIVLVMLFCLITVGIFHSLIQNTLSRRNEFAVLRAIGFSPEAIQKMIRIQFLSFVGIGLVSGSILGAIVTFALAMIDRGSPVVLDWQLLLLIVVGLPFASYILARILGRKMIQGEVLLELTQDNK